MSAIAGLRRDLNLTQAGLAHLLGCHMITVSRWERGLKTPSPWQRAMLGALYDATRSGQPLDLSCVMEADGVPRAWLAALTSAFTHTAP